MKQKKKHDLEDYVKRVLNTLDFEKAFRNYPFITAFQAYKNRQNKNKNNR